MLCGRSPLDGLGNQDRRDTSLCSDGGGGGGGERADVGGERSVVSSLEEGRHCRRFVGVSRKEASALHAADLNCSRPICNPLYPEVKSDTEAIMPIRQLGPAEPARLRRALCLSHVARARGKVRMRTSFFHHVNHKSPALLITTPACSCSCAAAVSIASRRLRTADKPW